MIDFRWAVIGGLLLLVGCQMATAETRLANKTVLETVELGLAGQAKVGYWTPVCVTLTAGREGFEGCVVITAPDGDGVAAQYRQAEAASIDVPAQQIWTGWRYVKLGRLESRVRVSLRNADGVTVDSKLLKQPAIRPTTDFWVVSAGADVGIEESSGFLVRAQAGNLMHSRLTHADQFPDRWYGYEGVDTVVLPCGQSNPLEDLSDQQFGALLQWLELGGRVLLAAGSRAAELFSAPSRLAELRPGEFQELATRWRASGLENYATASQPLLNPDRAPLAVFSQLRGRVVCWEGAGGGRDRALVTKYPFGLGQVTYVALDLDQTPLANWPDRPRFVARLLRDNKQRGDGGRPQESLGQVTHIGFTDLIGQLRGGLDKFTDVVPVRFSWIAGILIVYVLLLGPIDFFGLHKFGWYRWTWLTFPTIVIAFCLLATVLGDRWKAGQPKINQVDIVDVDARRSLVRGTTWAHYYSPRAVAIDVSLQPRNDFLPAATFSQLLMSWQGLPGSGLGGMNTSASVGELSGAYTIYSGADQVAQQDEAIVGLPIHTASTKAIVARWSMRTPPLEPGELTVTSRSMLAGRVRNPLSIPLSNCVVFYDNWSYRLERRLLPGDEAELSRISPLDLKWQLTRRRLLKTTDVSTPWEQSEFDDLPRILEMLMFHDAAGGQNYTRLTHRYQAFIDLSSLLQTGRAILVGKSRQRATEMSRDQQVLVDDDYDQHWTYYRIMIPVQLEQ